MQLRKQPSDSALQPPEISQHSVFIDRESPKSFLARNTLICREYLVGFASELQVLRDNLVDLFSSSTDDIILLFFFWSSPNPHHHPGVLPYPLASKR